MVSMLVMLVDAQELPLSVVYLCHGGFTLIHAQVPTLAYESEAEPQLHTVYESLICNEFLEVRHCLPITAFNTISRAPITAPHLIKSGQPCAVGYQSHRRHECCTGPCHK